MSIGARYRDDIQKKKILPPLTFCPWPAYRKHGFYFNKKLLDENTFALEDIFQPDTVKELRNQSIFKIKEVRNYQMGKCFTLTALNAFPKYGGFNLMLKKNFDLILYIHSVEDEFWINFLFIPTLSSKVLLTVKSLEGASIGTLHLTEKEVTKLDKENMPCRTYEKTKNPHSKFIECRKNVFKNSRALLGLKCLLPGFDDLVPNDKLRECSNLSEAAIASNLYGNLKWDVNSEVVIELNFLKWENKFSLLLFDIILTLLVILINRL